MRARVRAWWDWLRADTRIQVHHWWLPLAGLLLLIIAGVSGYRWLFFLAYLLLLLPFVAYVWLRRLMDGIVITRSVVTAQAQVGELLTENWTCINNAAVPLLWLTVDDQSTLPGHTARRATGAGSYDTKQWEIRTRCLQRGHYLLGPTHLQTGDPFGLFTARWTMPARQSVLVYPPLLRLPTLPPLQGRRGGSTRADLLQQRTTPSIGGVRPYVPGDVPGRIHWPSSVRHQALQVKQFDQEQAGARWLLVDLASDVHMQIEQIAVSTDLYSSYTQRSQVEETETVRFDATLELSLAVTSSLAAQSLAEGHAVGLLLGNQSHTSVVPERGTRQYWRIVEPLVHAQADATDALALQLPLLRHQVPGLAESSLTLITADLRGDWLPTLAGWISRGRANVVLIGETVAAVLPLQQQLQQRGVATLVLALDQPLRLLHPPDQANAVRRSPLGRVVGRRKG